MKDIKPITDQQKSHYQELLNSELKEVSEQIHKQKAEFSETQGAPVEDGDQAALEMERSDIRARIRRLTERTHKISRVLDNFDEDFGFCIECGNDMDSRRLDIDPAFLRCIDCEEIFQKRSRHYAAAAPIS